MQRNVRTKTKNKREINSPRRFQHRCKPESECFAGRCVRLIDRRSCFGLDRPAIYLQQSGGRIVSAQVAFGMQLGIYVDSYCQRGRLSQKNKNHQTSRLKVYTIIVSYLLLLV